MQLNYAAIQLDVCWQLPHATCPHSHSDCRPKVMPQLLNAACQSVAKCRVPNFFDSLCMCVYVCVCVQALVNVVELFCRLFAITASVSHAPHTLLHFLLLCHFSSNSISTAQAVARSAAAASSSTSSSLSSSSLLLLLPAAVSCKNFQGCHVDCLCLRIISVIKYDPEIRLKLASKFFFSQLCADFLFFLFASARTLANEREKEREREILICYFSVSNCECD